MPDTANLITIQLNGEKKRFENALTLTALLSKLSVPKEKVVIELNAEIVPKDRLDQVTLKDGDEVEIVHFVGGGS